MTPQRFLLVFGTSYGQTEKIARRIRDVLSRRGHDVTLTNAAGMEPSHSLQTFDAVIVGASVIAQGHQKAVVDFVQAQRDALNHVPSAFFSVSASAASPDAKGRAAAQRILDEFLTKHGWRPRLAASMAGAINYTKYGLILRWFMKRASRKNGGSVDTSRDHEYTDWAQVEQFATQFAELVEGSLSPAGTAA